jgi:hypothetical protein
VDIFEESEERRASSQLLQDWRPHPQAGSPIASIFRNRFLNSGDINLFVTSVNVLLCRRIDKKKMALDNVREA